jgi:hypothetical protein
VKRVFTKLGENYRVSTAAQWLSHFLQANLQEHHDAKPLYSVFRGVLERLDHSPSKMLAFAELLGFVLYFLMIEGLLPSDYLQKQAPHLQPFYDALFGEVALPNLVESDRLALADWLTTLVHLLGQKCLPIPTSLL